MVLRTVLTRSVKVRRLESHQRGHKNLRLPFVAFLLPFCDQQMPVQALKRSAVEGPFGAFWGPATQNKNYDESRFSLSRCPAPVRLSWGLSGFLVDAPNVELNGVDAGAQFDCGRLVIVTVPPTSLTRGLSWGVRSWSSWGDGGPCGTG